MELIKAQRFKEKAFKYLISKGFSLKTYLISREEAPSELLEFIGTKKVIRFQLIDRNNEKVDSIFAEYGPCENSWERMWRNLSS